MSQSYHILDKMLLTEHGKHIQAKTLEGQKVIELWSKGCHRTLWTFLLACGGCTLCVGLVGTAVFWPKLAIHGFSCN